MAAPEPCPATLPLCRRCGVRGCPNAEHLPPKPRFWHRRKP